MTISYLLRTTALAGSILTILALSTTNASQTELSSEKTDVTSQCAVKVTPPTPPQSSRWWWPFTWGASKSVTPLVPSLTEDKREKKEDVALKGSSEGSISSAPSVTPSTSEKEATSEIDTGIKKISSAASSDDFFLLEPEKQENTPTIPSERLSSSGESTSVPPLPEAEAEKKGESGQEAPSSFLETPQEENNLPLNSITLPDQTSVSSPTQSSGDVKPQLTPEKLSDTSTSHNRPQEAKKQLKKKKAKNHPNQSKKNRKKKF